jgi:aldoxime dehydratase
MDMEPAIPPALQCPRSQAKRMPAGFETPYPTWMARYTDGAGPFVMAYFGVQQLALLPPDAMAPVEAMLAAKPAPGHWLRAQCHDSAGYDTRIAIAYWPDPQSFEAWREASGFDTWWRDPARETEPVGRFLEVIAPPLDRLEVMYTKPTQDDGVGHLQSHVSILPIVEHGYWGSMRDRIAASQVEALTAPASRTALHREGCRVTVAPHENLCMIRSGQNWANTSGEERDLYLGQVRPTLISGMTFLRDEGLDIGCFSCRFMQVLDASGAPTESSFGQAYFSDIGALEAWAEHHPTHLAIFNTFLQTMAPLGGAMKTSLFHEVTALEPASQSFEYINCHPKTGLMAAAAHCA